jgi:hypothetical protein
MAVIWKDWVMAGLLAIGSLAQAPPSARLAGMVG